jgi:hypothetical protein
MPRVDFSERLVRDRFIHDLWLSGHSLRAIAGHPGVNLSLVSVHRVVARESIQLGAAEELAEQYAAAYRAAIAGDMRAARRCRLLVARLRRLAPPSDVERRLVAARSRA